MKRKKVSEPGHCMKNIFAMIIMVFALSGVAEAKSLRIGGPVPSLRLPNIAGKQIDTERLKGRTMVIYFWNNQCGCQEQLVQLRKFITGQKDRPSAFPFAFLAVNEGQSKTVAES